MNKTAEILLKKNPGCDPMVGPQCPYCGSNSLLRPASFIYGASSGLERNMWVCSSYPTCNSYVGTHQHGKFQNFPMGRLADSTLRTLKKQAHHLFDQQWQNKIRSRTEMYKWLQETMHLSEPEAHIGEMDEDQCGDLIHHLNNLYMQQAKYRGKNE